MSGNGRAAALAGLLVVSSAVAVARPGSAQTKDAVQAEATASAGEQVTLDYGGVTWAIDPAKGPVQAVVTKRTVEAGGTTIEGIVFLEDAGGWRVAGAFRDESPGGALLASGVDAELTLAPAGD
jgi:hypothetical protein